MAGKTVDISFDSIKAFFEELIEKITTYFERLTLYQQIAWGVLGLGLLLFILSFVL